MQVNNNFVSAGNANREITVIIEPFACYIFQKMALSSPPPLLFIESNWSQLLGIEISGFQFQHWKSY